MALFKFYSTNNKFQHLVVYIYLLAFGLAYGMISASAVNTPMPMINSVGGLGNLGSVSSTQPNIYSINNMAASLLAQSKFSQFGMQANGAAIRNE